MLRQALNKVMSVIGDCPFGMNMLADTCTLFYGGFMQVFKDLLWVKRLAHDPTTTCQTLLKLFRLILNELDQLLQLHFGDNAIKIINEHDLMGLLDVKKLH